MAYSQSNNVNIAKAPIGRKGKPEKKTKKPGLRTTQSKSLKGKKVKTGF